MKPFRFTMEAVATIRKRAESETLEAYAAALLARQRAANEVAAAQARLEAVWAEMRHEMSAGCPAFRLTTLRVNARALEEERARREAALTQTERDVNTALQTMLVARQQREGVEKCRTRQRQRHDHDQATESQKFLDELATQRASPAMAWRTTDDPLA